ncbi:hypothetical protein EII34_09540 [Arachnia propionica]|uniref:Uncharacterized protein n=1 Tax=Arachnia propionica TaxID=1750 RepID=A0A3P1T4Z1_9ACTN|nr:hypothetical protein [Arachnia propionica]RRD04541.1 hypothetical protein EII34_09540 [Arachnia propionica]
MTERLSRLCAQWLEQLQDWRVLAPRGGGLSAPLATRHWLLRVYRKNFPDSLVKEDEDRRLGSWLAEHEPQILVDLRLVRRVVDHAMDEVRRRGLDVTAGTAAECLVRAVAKGWLRDEPLGEMELEAVVSTHLANAPSLGRMLEREEFGRFQELYDQLWLAEGEAHLLAHPHSRVMLGDDERPPLTRSGRENTWDGLARSVHSRFRLAVKDTVVPGDGEELARAEVARACGRLGLHQESALVVLYSLLKGLLMGRASVADQPCQDPDEDRSWERTPGPVTATGTSDLPVNDELTALAEAMIRTFCARQEQGRYLLRNEQMERAHQHAMRRAWMDCLMQDRRRRPIEATEARRIVTRAVFKGIPSGEEHRRRALTLSVADLTCPEADPAAEVLFSSPDPDALNRAYAWFVKNPEVAEGLREHDPERMEEYRRAAEEFLLPDLDYMMNLVEKENP